MSRIWTNTFLVVLTMAATAAIILNLNQTQPIAAQGAAAVTARFTVVHTEGHNLLVTDNKDNVLYFYTIDENAEIGSDLKLRGKVDLNQVGKEVIKPDVTFTRVKKDK